MAHVFVSHASRDVAIAVRVREWLGAAGHEVFLDRDLNEGLRVGDAWRKRLFEELYRADALVCLLSMAFSASPWCAAEVGIAQSHGLRILPVVIEPNATHRLVPTDTQWADLAADPAAARADLVEALRRLDAAGRAAWTRSGSPYPGLQAFDSGMARVFFGRQAETRRLAERLRAPVLHSAGLLVVVGPSGCGKSSLVRAGLVPLLDDDPGWLVLPLLVPGAEPVGALARVLAAAGRARGLGWTVASTGAVLEEAGGLGWLATELTAVAAPARQLLLVVDQAEELLTRAGAADREWFAALLADTPDGTVRAVATLRSEFLDPVAELAAEAGLLVATFLLAPLERDLLPQVIVGPARQAGMAIDDELVARLVADTGSGQALPLLAFVLDRLAAGIGRGGQLSAVRYDELGGVQGALAAQADTAMAAACAATGRSRREVLAGLLRLVTVDDSGQATRRRVDYDDLPGPVRTELDVFVTARLLTVDTDDGKPVVTVAHEKVLTAWRPLTTAIARSADFLRLRRSLEDAAADWDARNQPADHLWEPRRTATAEDTLDPSDLSPTAIAFLRAGRRHGRRRRLRATAVLGILLLLVTAGGLLAAAQWRTAADERDDAEKTRLIAIADGLVTRADALRDTDPRAALRFGLAAHHVAPEYTPAKASLLAALTSSSLSASLTADTAWMASAAFSRDGKTVATGTNQPPSTATGTGTGSVLLWDLTDRHGPRRIGNPLQAGAREVDSVAFSPDGKTLAIGTSQPRTDYINDLSYALWHDGSVTLWDLTDRQAPRQIGNPLPTGDGQVNSVAFSPDGATLAAGINQPTSTGAGSVLLWDLTDRQAPRRTGDLLPRSNQVWSLAFATGKPILAAGTGGYPGDGAVLLWDLTDRQTPRRIGNPLRTGDGYMYSVAFSPDGTILATGTNQFSPGDTGTGLVVLWDLTDREAPRKIGEPIRTLTDSYSVAFSPSSPTLATSARQTLLDGSIGEAVALWDLTDRQAPRHIGTLPEARSDEATPMMFSPDGTALATGSNEGSVILWDLTNRQAPQRIGNPLSTNTYGVSLAFSPDGTTLVIGSIPGERESDDAKPIVLWDLTTPRAPRPIGNLPSPETSWPLSVAFPRDGTTLATATVQLSSSGDAEFAVILWDLTDPQAPRQIGKSLQTDSDIDLFQVAFSSNGTTLAASGVQNRPNDANKNEVPTVVVLWDLTDPQAPRQIGKPLRTGLTESDEAPRVAVSPDGALASTVGEDGALILWDLTDRQAPHTIGASLQTGTGRVDSSVAFSSDGALASTEDGSVILWDLTDRQAPHPIGAPLSEGTVEVGSLTFSPDGSTLAGLGIQTQPDGNEESVVVLWDLTDRQAPRPIGDPLPIETGGKALSLAFSRNGATLVAGTEEGSVILWDLTTTMSLRADLAGQTCKRVGRGLTPQEWSRYIPGLPYVDTCPGRAG